MQKTANTATAQNAQLATGIRQQVADIANLMNIEFSRINEELHDKFVNQNHVYHTMEKRHWEYDQWLT